MRVYMFTIVLCTHHMDEAEMLGWCVHVCTCGCIWVHVYYSAVYTPHG